MIQQLREAFPYRSGPRFWIFDRDPDYGLEVTGAVRPTAIRLGAIRSRVLLKTVWLSVRSKPAGVICCIDIIAL